MTITLFSQFAYKLLTIFISVIYAFNPYLPPIQSDYIKGCKENGANMTFVAWADTQFSNAYAERIPFLDASFEDLTHAGDGVDALMIAGDVTENGLLCEYQYLYDNLKKANVDNFIMAVGNHDVRLKAKYAKTVSTFTHFNNILNESVGSELQIEALHYSYEIKGYKFIVLGTDRTEFEESYFNDAQLQWLNSELAEATADGKPAFVICHQTIKWTHGLPDTWNSPIEQAGSVGKQSDQLKEILNRYDNVFFITGHLHTGIGKYTYEKVGKVNSVNLPATGIVNKDGNYNDSGIGFVVEVYDGNVLFRARDFAKGIYLPAYNIDIPLSEAF